MPIIRIIYYCYFRLFNSIFLPDVNREFAVRLMAVTFMSLLSTALLEISLIYFADYYISHKLLFFLALLMIGTLYMVLVHKDAHTKSILKLNTTRSGLRLLFLIVIYSFSILIIILYTHYLPLIRNH
jgi:hypothetical protein